MRRIKVACTVIVEVDWQDDWYDPFFVIEENGCPGTGTVGAALEAAIAEGVRDENGASICWACKYQGENRILEIDGELVDSTSMAQLPVTP